MIETAGMGWLVVYSVYCICGEELGPRNWEICRAIACHAIGHGLPWCAAGDWNFEPPTLRASGWLSRMAADVLAADVDSTTHAGGKRGRHIDDVVVSRSVAAVGPRLSICAGAVIRTHDAVRMRLPVAPRQFVIRRLIRAAVFPRDMPIGPRQLFSTPTETVAAARAAIAMGEGGDHDAARVLIDDATGAILKHLEETLADAYTMDGGDRAPYLGRSRGVSFATGLLLGPKVGRYGRAAPTVRRLRLVQDRAVALACSARRLLKRLEAPSIQLDGRAGERKWWNDLSERARAAINTGHHVASIDGKRSSNAEVVSSTYALELKSMGKWVEQWATWAMGEIR